MVNCCFPVHLWFRLPFVGPWMRDQFANDLSAQSAYFGFSIVKINA
jgi:hypothetical protein